MHPTLPPERTNQQRFENYMRDNDYILPQPRGYIGSYSATKDTIHFTYQGDGDEFRVTMLPTELRKYQGDEGSLDLLEMLESRRLNHNNL